MKKLFLSFLGLVLLTSLSANAQNSEVQKKNEPPKLGLHWARGYARPGGGSSPDMTSHGGPIMTDSKVTAIYWGTSWTTTDTKIIGLEGFYQGFSGSNYAKTSDEYNGTNGTVGASVTYNGATVDTTRASGGNQTSAILAEVCARITNPVADGYYPVYTDLPRKGGYCAYHSWGSCQGVQLQFAFFWKLDGDAGCDPQSNVSGESQGLAALANVSAHELSEARTDPQGTGWFDSSGAENGDKCAWTFNVPSVKFPNGTSWKLQGEWSNYAYDHNTGYPNSSGQNGCLDGH
jgi:hypothetical protein